MQDKIARPDFERVECSAFGPKAIGWGEGTIAANNLSTAKEKSFPPLGTELWFSALCIKSKWINRAALYVYICNAGDTLCSLTALAEFRSLQLLTSSSRGWVRAIDAVAVQTYLPGVLELASRRLQKSRFLILVCILDTEKQITRDDNYRYLNNRPFCRTIVLSERR